MISRVKLVCVLMMTLLILIGFTTLLVSAQGFQQPIYRGHEITHLVWSPNSQIFTFYDGYDVALQSSTEGKWYQYDRVTNTLQQTSLWSLQPQLNATEIALYKPYTEDGKASFIYPSPNGTYLAYTTGDSQQNFAPQLMLANRSTGVVAETYTDVWDPISGLDNFEVVWNRTSTAFVVNAHFPGSASPKSVRVHVGGFSMAVTSLTATGVSLIVNGIEFAPMQAYSVADDGNYVLLSATDPTLTDPDMRLMRWNVATSSAILVGNFFADQVIGASFEAGNPDQVLLVNEAGVIRYIISTGQTTLLNSQVNAEWTHESACCNYRFAAFSSDGRWLVATRGQRDVYVFDLLTDFVPTPTFSSARLKVQYYPESTTRTTFVESIIPTLNIVNATSSPVNLSELMIRYYFRSDQLVRHEAFCAWTALPGNCATISVSEGITERRTPLGNGTADAFIDVEFTSGVLPANSQTGEIIVRTNKVDWSDFDQSNDYSFDPTSTSDTFKDWEKVVLYRNGNPIWGIEPQ